MDCGVGKTKPINKKIKTPIPSHLKSVVLANPPLLLFVSLISEPIFYGL